MGTGLKSFEVGMKARFSKQILDDDIRQMAEITGDSNPLHLDETYAESTRFKGRIAHGLFSAGLISATLATKLPGPGAIYLHQSLDFLHPVRPGEELTAEVEITEWRPEKRVMKLTTRCLNAEDKEVARGEAVLLIE